MRSLRCMGCGHWLVVLALAVMAGCNPTGGGGGGGDGDGDGNGGLNGGGNGGGGGPVEGGFEDNGLAAPVALEAGVDNIPPTGDVTFPPEGADLAPGEVVFVWEASDGNGTNLDNTVYVSRVPDVFDQPLVTQGVRTSPDDTEHRLAMQLPDAGTYFWGVEITDGVTTIRRPAQAPGVEFQVSATGTDRIGIDDAILVCPRETQTAREVTTFQWSFGEAVPVRTQVFVSRAGEDNPFDAPLRVFEVEPPTATSLPLTAADALPLGQELSWGLRIQTADDVLFTFEGQLGARFLVAANVPPFGELTGPPNDTAFAEGASLDLVWNDDPGNCEDEQVLTIAFEFLGDGEEPLALFDSETQFTASAATAEASLFPELEEVEFQAGRWAWGVRADDGTDQTILPDADNPDRTFKTFIADNRPRFTVSPAVNLVACGLELTSRDAITFTYEDGNGAETVDVSVTFAGSENDVFDAPAATLGLGTLGTGAGSVSAQVFLQSIGTTECFEFLEGPGFYGVELDDGANEPVRAIVEYAGATRGACCAPNGLCTEIESAGCVEGVYQGDGTFCATTECEILIGACCEPDGLCSDVLQEECTTGDFQGVGTTCDSLLCPVKLGGCCLTDGSCTEGLEEECLGEYQGDGTTCDQLQCPLPEQPEASGACCLAGGDCVVTTALTCDGVYQGDGTICGQVICITPASLDCNSNGVPDGDDIAQGFSHDCDLSGVPDECEGVGAVVDAGTLADGEIVGGRYDSLPAGNSLSGTLCPIPTSASVEWHFDGGPAGVEVSIRNPTGLNSEYLVQPALPGVYIFRLTWLDQGGIFDTVTLTLTGGR